MRSGRSVRDRLAPVPTCYEVPGPIQLLERRYLQELWQVELAIVKRVAVHPESFDRWHLLIYPASVARLRSVLGLGEGGEDIQRALGKLEEIGVSGPAAAARIRTVEETAARTPRPDLVWSGPEVPGLHARDTRRVYEELLGSAEHSLWACSYAYFDGPRAFEVLARRFDERPELRVTLLLNIQRGRGDTTAADGLVRRFADRFWGTDWPGSSRPRVFYDPRSLEPDGPMGVLHAKAVVADDEAVFITSANLTEAALDRNIEMGLLVRDRALADSVLSHFRGLVDRGLLSPLPTT
jgi:phosphatidylserine/phosphatidylglycerophosphate/cardiolipin synthase-like enzyme